MPPKFLLLCGLLHILSVSPKAQPITGVWRGKVTRSSGLGRQTFKLEVKLVKKGDSLTGTSYYYATANHYYRYSVKGFFGRTDNSVTWWDDRLIESRTPGLKIGSTNHLPLLANADFNCPGGDLMKLDGNAHPKEGGYAYDIHLDKYSHPDFADEWDPIIENYFTGGADPHLIDSVSQIAFVQPVSPPQPTAAVATPPAPPIVKETTVYFPPAKKEVPPSEPATTVPTPISKPVTTTIAQPNPPQTAPPASPATTQPPLPTQPVVAKTPPTIEEKFSGRKNVLTTEIPVSGDSIELHFYDNAEVDGDSISVFLNGVLLYTHIRLGSKAYSIKMATAQLLASNDLVMVAENLGSIPPNTAYMEAWSGGRRYTARLESTEQNSAMIRLKKE
jgi:hypothetical protein